MVERNLPNAGEQRSPIIFQSRDNSLDASDPADAYTKFDYRTHLYLDISSGEVEVKFIDSDGNEVTPSLIINSSDPEWDYDWALKSSAPAEIHISATQDSTTYHIRGERS